MSEDGVKPDPEKVRAVKNFPVPKNVHDVRSFLGLCSYYRRFIKNFCDRAQPLQELLKGDSKFAWDSDQIKSFGSLKAALISDPIRESFEEKAPTEIHVDARARSSVSPDIDVKGKSHCLCIKIPDEVSIALLHY